MKLVPGELKSVPGLIRDRRGAVFVEHLIAFLPVIVIGLSVWQLIELAVADLVIKRAASAAARAAIVVMPDNPAFYDGEPEMHRYEGQRRSDIELAASLVLATNPHFQHKPDVAILQGPGEHGIRSSQAASLWTKFKGWLGLGAGVKNPAALAGAVAGVVGEGGGETGPHAPLTVLVTARFECFAIWANVVCGGGSHRWLQATASYPYQGAAYQ